MAPKTRFTLAGLEPVTSSYREALYQLSYFPSWKKHRFAVGISRAPSEDRTRDYSLEDYHVSHYTIGAYVRDRSTDLDRLALILQIITLSKGLLCLSLYFKYRKSKRLPGIEPGTPPWQGGLLPLHHRRIEEVEGFEPPCGMGTALGFQDRSDKPDSGTLPKFLAEDPGLEPGSLFRGATLAPWSLTN